MGLYIDEEKFTEFFEVQLDYQFADLQRLYEIFENHIDELLSTGQVTNDLEVAKAAKVAHKIRTSCRSFGANKLAVTLEEFESNAKASTVSESNTQLDHLFGLAKMSLKELDELMKTHSCSEKRRSSNAQ